MATPTTPQKPRPGYQVCVFVGLSKTVAELSKDNDTCYINEAIPVQVIPDDVERYPEVKGSHNLKKGSRVIIRGSQPAVLTGATDTGSAENRCYRISAEMEFYVYEAIPGQPSITVLSNVAQHQNLRSIDSNVRTPEIPFPAGLPVSGRSSLSLKTACYEAELVRKVEKTLTVKNTSNVMVMHSNLRSKK
ncbi:hypothetical protein H0H92_005017 [Tricholoma furcatifolium]|nr:hypothetical protein H0H92_005017 [Tricholoma furcatifolium]